MSFLEGVALEDVYCSLCGGGNTKTLSRRDAVGLPARTVMCLDCGLIYLNPRPNKEWYEKFYSSVSGKQHAYKESAHTDESKPIGWGFEKARQHGRALAERLGQYMRPGLTIDVGSSEGGVLAGLGDRLNITPLGIEPAAAEAEYAAAKGIPTHAALIENIEFSEINLPPADNVVCVKSLNHFLDPAYFFTWAWKTLKPGGRLILEVKNFRHQVRRSGRIRSGIQLDHPYMYTPQTLSLFVERAGFEILHCDIDEEKTAGALRVQRELGLPAGHIRIAARKTDRQPFSVAFASNQGTVSVMAREFRSLSLWLHYLRRHANIRKNILARFRRFT